MYLPVYPFSFICIVHCLIRDFDLCNLISFWEHFQAEHSAEFTNLVAFLQNLALIWYAGSCSVLQSSWHSWADLGAQRSTWYYWDIVIIPVLFPFPCHASAAEENQEFLAFAVEFINGQCHYKVTMLCLMNQCFFIHKFQLNCLACVYILHMLLTQWLQAIDFHFGNWIQKRIMVELNLKPQMLDFIYIRFPHKNYPCALSLWSVFYWMK